MKKIAGLLLVTWFVCLATAFAKPQEESVFLFQNRKVTLLIPDGFGFASSKDLNGLMNVEIAHPKDKVRLTITFVPDPEETFSSARSRKEFLAEQFSEYIGGSVEKTMAFEELDPKTGAATYCVFTDANLVGKSKLPPGEYLHLTSGIKAWPGVAAVFRMFSNDTRSKEYQAMMSLLRDSVEEQSFSPLL